MVERQFQDLQGLVLSNFETIVEFSVCNLKQNLRLYITFLKEYKKKIYLKVLFSSTNFFTISYDE